MLVVVRCRCYSGGEKSEQTQPFQSAVAEVMHMYPEDSLHVEIMPIKVLRESEWTPKQLVTWLLEAHIHFIICHPHDGTVTFQWPAEELYSEMERLRFHTGFPNENWLHCPIFTQDKYRYLELLPKESIMPTLKVPISANMDRATVHSLVSE